MSGLLFSLPLGLLVAAVVAGVVAAAVLQGETGPEGEVVRVPRGVAVWTAAWRWSGLLVGAAGAWVVAGGGALGRGPMLAAPVLALGLLLGVLLGELTVPVRRGAVRAAALQTRRVRDYLPRRLAGAVAAATGWLALVLALTTAMGSADDMGRAGRSLARQCSAVMGEARGPWPGVYYSLPLALSVLLGLVAAGLALRRITTRPRPGLPDGSAGDDLLRRRAASATTAACGVLVTLPLVGVSFFAASALGGFGCRPVTWSVLAWLLAAPLPVWLVLLAVCAVQVLVPDGGLRRAPEPVVPRP